MIGVVTTARSVVYMAESFVCPAAKSVGRSYVEFYRSRGYNVGMLGMTVTEAAGLWGVSPETVRTWCRKGLVVAQRVGRSWLVLSEKPPEVALGRPRESTR